MNTNFDQVSAPRSQQARLQDAVEQFTRHRDSARAAREEVELAWKNLHQQQRQQDNALKSGLRDIPALVTYEERVRCARLKLEQAARELSQAKKRQKASGRLVKMCENSRVLED